MSKRSAICMLRGQASQLIDRCLCDVQQSSPQASADTQRRARSAEFLLLECKEYVQSACDSLGNGLPRASLTASRWILEAALNLLWATAEAEEVDVRIRKLVAEACRLEARRLEGLAELYPDEADVRRAQDAHNQRRDLLGPDTALDSLDTRLRSMKTKFSDKGLPNPYALYRICCDAAHPGMAVWRRFRMGADGEIIAQSPPDATHIAAWMIAAGCLYLVGGAYCLSGLGDAGSLDAWWKKEIVPLLDGLARC